MVCDCALWHVGTMEEMVPNVMVTEVAEPEVGFSLAPSLLPANPKGGSASTCGNNSSPADGNSGHQRMAPFLSFLCVELRFQCSEEKPGPVTGLWLWVAIALHRRTIRLSAEDSIASGSGS